MKEVLIGTTLDALNNSYKQNGLFLEPKIRRAFQRDMGLIRGAFLDPNVGSVELPLSDNSSMLVFRGPEVARDYGRTLSQSGYHLLQHEDGCRCEMCRTML